jgi:hypothetical protein
MKMLLKMLPRVMDFDEHRRVVALLADDNADLRFRMSPCFPESTLSRYQDPQRIFSNDNTTAYCRKSTPLTLQG